MFVCPDNKSEESLRVFWERVLLLKKVTSGNHCHVVQLVGCIVQELPAAILVEYSAEGNLLTYLRGGGAVRYTEGTHRHVQLHSRAQSMCSTSMFGYGSLSYNCELVRVLFEEDMQKEIESQ